MLYPQHDKVSKDYPDLPAKEQSFYTEVNKLAAFISVARVRPRTSKGITDLLLPRTSYSLIGQSPSKKLYDIAKCASYLAGRGLVR